MDIYTNIPYTYRIRWSTTGMNYYGVRYAKDCHPSDLFVTYFTSSKYVADYIKEHGLPDVIEVRKVFTCENRVNRARRHETKVLRRVGAKDRNDFLNKSDNISIAIDDPLLNERRRQSIIVGKNKPEAKGKVSGLNWWRSDKKIYDWEHIDGRVEQCTRVELINKYGLRADKVSEVVNGKSSRKSHGGWKLAGTIAGIDGSKKSGKNHPSFDHNEYCFIHDNGTIEKCTRYYFYNTYNLNPIKVMNLVRGIKKSYKGWRLKKA